MNRKITLLLILIIFCVQASAEKLVIQSRIDFGNWSKKKAIYPLIGQKILLKVDSIPMGNITWYQIIPDCSSFYKNANHPWEEDPYKWIGFDKIKYFKEEIIEHRGKWTIEPNYHNQSYISEYFNNDVGSFWVQAVVQVSGKTLTSSGIEDTDYRGLSPDVFRISIRESEGYIGYLTSFFNVPGLFGSVPYQCDNYIGADCADVLMAAYTRFNGMSLKKDYNVAMLVSTFTKIATFKIINGNPNRNIEWQSQVIPGNLIAVRYNGARQFQHIGALYKDANDNGIIDSKDLVLHSGPYPLHAEQLSAGGFNGDVVILRIDKESL
jgi:hypothetical protein